MKFRLRGFSLIEVMVTVAILGVLATLAAPSFRTLLLKRSVQAAANSLVEDMRLARSEALKRSTRTVICHSSNGTSCTALAAGGWRDGWIVFVDMNSNGAVDAGDDLIKVQQVLPNIASVQSTNPNSDLALFKYEPTGWAKAATHTFIFTPVGNVPVGSTRVVCVSIQGRPALRAEGTTSCT
jgi:type IV fimbrial biogenesis protein FimT